MTGKRIRTSRRFLVPEVVQTSDMDCGPAALKCLLEGFGIHASYGRLREACQTDVDGTSIDTLEDIASQLSLDAQQIMTPADHLLLPKADILPALVVVVTSGATHFVVLWRRHGRFLQVMDPRTGRRWPSCSRFLDEVYVHTHAVPAANWREWAGSDVFLNVLEDRLRNVGVSKARRGRLLHEALADPGWRRLACLDAATRMTASIVGSGGVRKGRQAAGILERYAERAFNENGQPGQAIPDVYWSVRPDPAADESQLLFRGAVLLSVRGRITQGADSATHRGVSPELEATLDEAPTRPWRELLKLVGSGGFLAPVVLVSGLLLAAAGVLIEALLFRGLFDIAQNLSLSGQRLAAVGLLLVFLMGLLLLELPIAAGALRLGRHLEVRLRTAFLEKIPRLADRYFQSRLSSDMAERSHSIHQIRLLPDQAAHLARSAFELVLTTAGIIWIDPAAAPIAALAAGVALVLPLVSQPVLAERDLRLRTHTGGLTRFYLDAFLGLVAIKAHGAGPALRREHESLLVEWTRSGMDLQRAVVAVEGAQFFLGFALAAWLLLDTWSRAGENGAVLLLAYWALNLPVLGEEIALVAWQYPAHRNLTLRLLEPLGAPEANGHGQAAVREVQPARGARGVAVSFEDVAVRAAGHTILREIDLKISPGSHVAVVGSSGAGKSSLVGLLLGWHRAANGQILVDGESLDAARLARLRRETVWIDPTVQLWNRSLLANLHYGNEDHVSPMDEVIKKAELRELLEKMPDGLQTVLGEGGRMLSGGEGQRVRLARGMLRPAVRLIILDEPFSGLERTRRRDLLARVRSLWPESTMLCITHDVGETVAFERVLVMQHGRIIEDGIPSELAARPDSQYRALLDAEEALRRGLWSDAQWRSLRLEDGRLVEKSSRAPL